ncbi:MAG: hypothetical protein H6994_04925 [Pseudomonadales bacterium]|nr:hypothetical protein [Pseudomonadales bacterium]
MTGNSGTATVGAEVDTFTSIEGFSMGSGDDAITLDSAALSSLASFDGNGGTDTVVFDDAGATLTDSGLDGADFAAVFSDVEELDFRNTDLTGGDTFDIGNDEIGSMNSGSSMTILVDTGTIALSDINPLTQSGATITNDITVGNVRTVDWSDGTHLEINGGP